MMEILKVRAWDTSSSPPKMLYWGKDFFDLHLKHDSMRIKVSPGNEGFELHVLTNEFFRKDMPSCQGEVILMVSTGIKDKDGEEIWSGDIISDGKKNYPIYFDEMHCRWRAKGYYLRSQDVPWDFTEEIYLIKKVGNIFENPELLEKKQ